MIFEIPRLYISACSNAVQSIGLIQYLCQFCYTATSSKWDAFHKLNRRSSEYKYRNNEKKNKKNGSAGYIGSDRSIWLVKIRYRIHI
jgi:hypothetical protein